MRLRGEEPLLLGDVLLEDVGLQGPVEDADVDALAFGGDEVHAEDRHGGAADRHRGGHLAQRYAAEQHLHVGRRVDRHAAVPNLTEAVRVVGVAAHERGHVERDRQTATAAFEDHLVALVGLHRVAEAGELPNRPGAPAIAGRVEPTGEGELPRPADPLHALALGVGLRLRYAVQPRPVDRVERHTGQGGEVRVPDLAACRRLVVAGLPAGRT